ncbi:MAG: succinate dehydrogenase, hydrophobic membrane anchor protein [Bauldia sp.]|nr:succinate dehydrogenase, hydrophobic membrane anchor protein [Bauldia sp.]MCW5718288.1 succinate dehydrogenase, hydrophobic membrane anchor protein [Bauldia sp.]
MTPVRSQERRTGEGAIPVADRRQKGGGAGRSFQKRFTSMLLLPLTVTAIFLGTTLAGADQGTVARIVGHPFIAIALFAFVALVAVHMTLGVIDIVADYVHGTVMNRLAIAGAMTYSAVVVGASGWALLKLSLGD